MWAKSEKNRKRVTVKVLRIIEEKIKGNESPNAMIGIRE
jgi:hypothetical protein